jgi:hypothetical protein
MIEARDACSNLKIQAASVVGADERMSLQGTPVICNPSAPSEDADDKFDSPELYCNKQTLSCAHHCVSNFESPCCRIVLTITLLPW